MIYKICHAGYEDEVANIEADSAYDAAKFWSQENWDMNDDGGGVFDLIIKDPDGKPYRAEVEVSVDVNFEILSCLED